MLYSMFVIRYYISVSGFGGSVCSGNSGLVFISSGCVKLVVV